MFARATDSAVVAIDDIEVTVKGGQAYDMDDDLWSRVIARWPHLFDVPEVETGAKKGRR